MAEDLATLLAVCEKASRSKFPVTIDPVAVLPVVRRAADLIEQQAASLAAKDKEISTLRDHKERYFAGWNEEVKLRQDLQIEHNALQSRAEQAERASDLLRAELDTANANHRQMAKQMADLGRALAEAVEVRDLLKWLTDQTNLQLSFSGWDEADAWEVYSVTGGRNDREWRLIASGVTPTEALRAARAFVAQHGSDSREGK